MFIVKEVGVCGGVCVWKGERGDQDAVELPFFPRATV